MTETQDVLRDTREVTLTAPGKAATKTPARRSLTDYVKAKRREGCPVCALGTTIIAQMKEASNKKIGRPVVVEWLSDEFGVTVTRADMDSHYNGRHDE
jgi:hypothetical protein